MFSIHVLEDGQPPVEVSFRWTISPLASMKSHVFKPNAPDPEAATQDGVKTATLASYYQGNYQKVPRNTKASLIWEAGCWILTVFLHSILTVLFSFGHGNCGRWISARLRRGSRLSNPRSTCFALCTFHRSPLST